MVLNATKSQFKLIAIPLRYLLLSIVFIVFILLVLSKPCLAKDGGGGSAGGTAAPITGCDRGSETCYSSHNTGTGDDSGGGGEWLRVPIEELKNYGADPNAIPYSIIRTIDPIDEKNSPKKLSYKGDSQVVTGCGEAKYVYVFVSHVYRNDPNTTPPYAATGKAYGPNRFSYFWEAIPGYPNITVEQRYVNRGGGYHADYSEAKQAFDLYLAKTGRKDIVWEKGNFSWFCSFENKTPDECDPNDPNCKKPQTPDPVPSLSSLNCGRDLPGVSTSPYKGNTVADSAVVNLSYTGTLDFRKWQNTSKGKNFVLARPGDSIRFRHTMCYTAQALGKNLEGHPKIDKENRFQIFAKRNGTEDNHYLFGQSALLDGNTHAAHAHDTHQIKGTGIVSADYGFTTESPTGSPSPDYLCNAIQFTQNNNRGIANGFQIPGFASGVTNCSATSRTTNSSEVGNTISQGLRFDDIRSWIKYTTHFHNRCGCDRDDAYEDHYEQTSYESAATSTNPKTVWGYNTISCYASGSCHKGEDTRYRASYSYSYPLASENRGTKETEAKVYVPYNFNTYVTSSIEAENIAFTGEQVDVSGSYHILPRQNELVSKSSYATITSSKETYRIYEMILPIYANPSNLHGAERSDRDVCSYYGVSNCNLIKTVNGPMNPNGNYAGSSKNTEIVSRTIPDNAEYVGYKYCIASSIWPASSHTSAANSVSDNTSGPAMQGGDETKFNISDLSCVTIAKKPNFQVWGGGMYTNGNIETAISKKTPGSGFSSYPGSAEKVFGSWDEYHVIAGGNVNGFGSGASLGYEKGYAYNLPTGGANYGNDLYNLTIANRKKAGQSGIPGLPSTLLSRLKARYRDNIARNSKLKFTTHDTGLQNAYIKGDVNLSAINLPDYNQKATSTLFKTNNSLYKTLANGEQNNTLVLYVDGALTIDQNICYATSAYNCENQPSTKQATYTDISTDSITKLPQILIFAKKINVTEHVRRIDAWLILDEDNAANNLNTCVDHNAPNALSCSETLIFNGPIFAKSLTLNRTGGANHSIGNSNGVSAADRLLGTSYRHLPGGVYYAASDDGSIAPAEIFNLRSDAYYWGISQAQRTGIAEVVYQRELAPRY